MLKSFWFYDLGDWLGTFADEDETFDVFLPVHPVHWSESPNGATFADFAAWCADNSVVYEEVEEGIYRVLAKNNTPELMILLRLRWF